MTYNLVVHYMKMSDLQDKDIINVKDGKNIGRIIDLEVTTDGNIKYLSAEPKQLFRLNVYNKEINFTFKQIVKIGKDVILVDLD